MASLPTETPTSGAGEEKQATQGQQGGARQGMLAVNDLNYVLAPDLSVSVNSTFKNHFFQSNSYENTQRGICILNSGADYADTRSSSLNFVMELSGLNAAETIGYFGKHGSIMNIIRSITISSRSGDEISRTIDLNHLCAMTAGFKFSTNWINTVGQTIGYGSMVMPNESASYQQHFSIPLYLLSDFFAYGRLLPAMVLAGLRIEIEWENPVIAFQGVSSTSNSAASSANLIQGYTITNPYIALKSVQLTDGTQRALNEMSAVNGLEIVYCDYERTESALGSGKTLNLEVRKAASRALKAFLSTRETDNITDGTKDSFRTEEFDYQQWQWQLGSLYFPQQPIKGNGNSQRLAIPETYNHTLVAFNTYKGDQPKTSAVPLRSSTHFLDTTNNSLADDTATVTLTNVTTLPNAGTVSAETGLVSSTGAVFAVECAAGVKVVITDAQGRDHAGVSTGPGDDTTEFFISPAPENDIVFDHTSGVRFVASGVDYTSTVPWSQPYNARWASKVSNEGVEGSFANGRSTVCVLLERSDLFNLTGVPINNSRVLAAQATYGKTRKRTATIFLKYVRLARVFLNNVEVEQ